MTGRHEKEINTGIYVSRRVEVPREGFTIKPFPNLKTLLADFERQARHMLTKHNVEVSRKTGWPKLNSYFPASAKPIVKDAVAILYRVHEVRRWVDRNHAENAALEALVLGRALERDSVRPFEPYVKTGRKIKESARSGGLMRKPPTEKWLAWKTAINELAACRPDLTFRALARKVGNQFGVNERTVRKRTTNPHEK